MRILVAPNAFKNSLPATEAAAAIIGGLKASRLSCDCLAFPVGDGGDGTATLIVEKCGGRWIQETVTGPLGREVLSRYALIDAGKTAVIEMADASGLRLLDASTLDPLRASSVGMGQLIRKALDHGVSTIIIGLGGSATVDGAAGALSALGVRFLDQNGQALPPTPAGLSSLHSIDTSALDSRVAATGFVVLSDVQNPLLGPEGAAAIFGPQKGADPEQVEILESMLSLLSRKARTATGRDMAAVPSGGAAGGAAAGLAVFLGATLVNGIDYFFELTGFDRALNGCDLVITGEGSIDEQTLNGKGPFGVAERARRLGIPVVALAGKVPLTENPALRAYFDVLLPIGHQASGLAEAMLATGQNLARTAHELGNLLALHRPR